MIKKTVIVLSLVVAAQCAATTGLAVTAFAQQTECPPECVTDSMEIVTWYPSPYSEYEELRLYPTTRDANYCDNDKIGLMYYDDGGTPSFADNDKIMVCKGTLLGWQELGGGSKAQAANYSASSRPVCTSDKWGTIIYDTTWNSPLICTNNDWVSIDINLAAASLKYSGSVSNHTRYDCTTSGGVVYTAGSDSICKFKGTNVSCPSGWVQADSWQRYASSSWGGDNCGRWKSTGSTAFSNTQSIAYYPAEDRGRTSGGTTCNGSGSSWCSLGSDDDWINPQPVCGLNDVGSAYNKADNRSEIGCK